jgi:hypothetical protein
MVILEIVNIDCDFKTLAKYREDAIIMLSLYGLHSRALDSLCA